MQKGNTSSKKVISSSNQAPIEQFKSQSSKASATSLKPKESVALQNMKEFKCQIDHQIAKCLDTLDRQGLKFLKETLRASKIFGLNTQELGLTQPVEQNIEVDSQSPQKPKAKEVLKKIQPVKPSTQTKKASKPESNKKVQPIASKNTKQVESKSDLNEKINKRLDSLNIKTGKKNETKAVNAKKSEPVEKQKVESTHIEIAEEIEIEEGDAKQESERIEESIKRTEVYTSPFERNSIGNPVFYDSSKQWLKNQSSELQPLSKTEQNALLKPFCKKQFKKHHEEVKHHKEHKDYGIEISKDEEFKRAINEDSMKKEETSKRKTPPQEEVKEIAQIIPQRIDSKQQVSESQRVTEKKEEAEDPKMQDIIAIISRLSPGKRSKLQRIIEKLQSSDKFQVTSALISNASNNEKAEISYHKPYIAQRQSFTKISDVKDNLSKSRSKLEKVEKATSLKNSLIKRINHNLTPENHGNLTPEPHKKEETNENHNNLGKEKNILEMYDNAKSQMISEDNKLEKKIDTFVKEPKQEVQISNNFSEKSQSNANQSETGQKLIKIGKKKYQITSILFKILSNNGHSSLVGLTSIQIFNSYGQIITIDQTNLKQSNSKLLKLFTENYKGEGWSTSLSNASISIENIMQQVGGIRIINWNKSELEVDRQTDMMQILINDQLHWRGQIRGGSYKENEIYSTNIKVMERHFEFPEIKQETSKSIVKEEKSPKLFSPSIRSTKFNLQEPIEKQQKKEVCWLQKETVEKKLKEIQEEQKKDEKVRKIGSIRNTILNNNYNEDKLSPGEIVIENKPIKSFEFGLNWLNHEDPKEKKQEFRYENESKSNLRMHHDNDILQELSKGVEIKEAKRKKDENSISIGKKKEELVYRVNKEESLSKKEQQEYLIKKEKEQDQEFEKILQSMQQRAVKPKEATKVETPKRIQVNIEKEVNDNKGKVVAEKNFQDFMKDSLFDDKPVARHFENKPIRAVKAVEQRQINDYNTKSQKNTNNKQLDNLIDQLNDVIGGEASQETGEQFYIPQLPKGKEISILLLSNWGNQNFIGLNGLQLFDSNGETIKPIGIACSLMNSKQLYEKLFKQELLTSDEKVQIKFPKNKRVAISITLSEKTELAAIRIWNYNGHRVHNNIGAKKLHIKFDNSFIFSGEIQQSSGSSEDAYKYCEHVLFTESNSILKKIRDNDWLSRINSNLQVQRMLFKTTLQNFHRPVTRNDEQIVKKQIQQIEIQKQPIKLPKRMCFQYDPPQLPEGFALKFVLHNSWGDRFFIGLSGIQIFNEKGENITNKNLSQIRADPSSISKLQGYQRDKRVVANLINGKNNTVIDSNIWLAPLLSDVQRIEKGRSNIILMEFSKPNRISGINFYNYIKTPERGVREIEVYLDNFLLYRGYLKKYSAESGILHTTINFTKEQSLLESMNYIGYNQDHLEQQVGLINEQKVIKANSTAFQVNLIRPMTGRILP